MIQLDILTQSHTELFDLTDQIRRAVTDSGVQNGVCHVFVPHTTAGLTLNENWDREVRGDLLRALDAMVPNVRFEHDEGNSPAHLLTAVMGNSQTVFISDGRLMLGSWQGIYLAEFDGPRRRRVLLKIVADPD